jgi:hypothetical protein
MVSGVTANSLAMHEELNLPCRCETNAINIVESSTTIALEIRARRGAWDGLATVHLPHALQSARAAGPPRIGLNSVSSYRELRER